MTADVKYQLQPNYPLRGAIYFGVGHILLAALITIWGYEKTIFQPDGAGKVFYLLELTGAEFTKMIGQTEDLKTFTPYLITFFISTIFYSLAGMAAGYLTKRFNLIEEINNVFLTEEETEQSSQ
ncbi:MAG: hypothetical protein AAB019_05015 [Planctomycetota bacterium]